MKKCFIYGSVAFSLITIFLSTPARASNFQYFRSLTVTSTASVASGTNSNFPMLVSSTITSWAATSSAGRIQNLVTAPNGTQEPADLIFVTSTPSQSGSVWSCSTPLNFETEKYVSSTGALIDWVNVPTLATSTVIYACYGATSVTTDQSHPSSTWNSNYATVWHFFAIPTSTFGILDSTANPINGTNNGGALPTSTLIDGGYYNPNPGGSGGTWVGLVAGTGSKLDRQNNFSVNAWVNISTPSCGASAACAILSMGTGGWYFRVVQNGANANLNFLQSQTIDIAQSTGHLALNTWQYVGLTLSGAGAGTFYLNGVAAGTFSTGITFNNSNGAYLFGDNGGAHEEFGSGYADEIEVASGTFTPSWEITSYNNQNSPSTFYALGSEQVPNTNIATGTFAYYFTGIIKLIGKFFLR